MLPRKFSLILIFSIILTLGLSISLGSLLAAWTSPASSPPEGNIAAPINTSDTGQAKQGGLIINTGDTANGLIVQYGNVGIGTTDPGAELEVVGNIIADVPTAGNHLTTKAYVDASGGGGCFDQYYESWCASHPNEKCARVGTMDYKCMGDFCTKAGISNDLDGDGVIGATDCNDNDITIVAATDGTCDGDADGKIDHTAYTTIPKPALADCADSNPSSYICSDNGTACASGTTCSSTYCVDGYCCNSACSGTCQACNVSGNIGTCANVPIDTDPASECFAVTCTNYIYGGTNPTCYKYVNITLHNGMCNGAGACYASSADSCSGQGLATITCGSTGCWKACVANSPATSYDNYSEVCYTDNQTHACVGNLVCDVIGTCKLAPGAACTADNQCGSGYLCGIDADGDKYLTSATTGTCISGGIAHTDCCDSDVNSNPGVSTYKTTANACGSYDWNCSGIVDKQATTCYQVSECHINQWGACSVCATGGRSVGGTCSPVSCGAYADTGLACYGQVKVNQQGCTTEGALYGCGCTEERSDSTKCTYLSTEYDWCSHWYYGSVVGAYMARHSYNSAQCACK